MAHPNKAPKPVKGQTAEETFALFSQNMEEIRRWYQAPRHPGQAVGHYVLSELILGHVTTALSLAIQGKRWEKPTPTP